MRRRNSVSIDDFPVYVTVFRPMENRVTPSPPFLAHVWREACQHIELADAVARMAKAGITPELAKA